MSPTDFFAISTAPERATFDCDMRDGMAPLNEAEAAEKETAAESMVCRGWGGWMRFVDLLGIDLSDREISVSGPECSGIKFTQR